MVLCQIRTASTFSALFASPSVREDPRMNIRTELRFVQLLCEGHTTKNQVRVCVCSRGDVYCVYLFVVCVRVSLLRV